MNRRRILWAAVAVFWAFHLPARGEAWYQADFPPAEFRPRWEAVFEKIGDKSVALVAGAPPPGGFVFPRQANEFYYLCGIETPGSYILLDGRTRRVTLFLPARNARLEAAEGRTLSGDDAEEVKRLTGADEVLRTDAMRGDWLGVPPGGLPEAVWTPFAPAEQAAEQRWELLARNAAIAADQWDGRLSREARLIELLRARGARGNDPGQVRDLTPVLDELRSRKSPREIALDPARVAAGGNGPARGDEEHAAGRLRVRARCRGPLRLSRQRRPPRGLSLDHGRGHREHLEHALLPEQRRGSRPAISS